MRHAAISMLAVAALLAAGCGGKKHGTTPDGVTVPARLPQMTAFTHQDFPDQGVAFDRPRGWRIATGAPPLLATITAGEITIAVWRYPREPALPSTPAELAAAKDALVKAIKARDPTLKVTKAKGTRAAHHPAVVIVANETVAGQPRIVRSTHVYADGGEVVIDAFAPPDIFPKVEDPVFRRVVHTLTVTAPAKK